MTNVTSRPNFKKWESLGDYYNPYMNQFEFNVNEDLCDDNLKNDIFEFIKESNGEWVMLSDNDMDEPMMFVCTLEFVVNNNKYV